MLSVKRNICLIVMPILGLIHSFSQERSIFNNSYLDPFIANPACTGMEYYPVAHLSIRDQWPGFSGAPFTLLLSGNSRLGQFGFYDPKGLVNKGPLKLKGRIGTGAAFYYDKNGPLSNTGGILSYGYHIILKNESRLSFGMSFLFSDYALNTSVLDPDQPNDDFLFTGNDDVLKINFGFGAFYYASHYFAGFSVNKILPGISNVNETVRSDPDYFVIAGLKTEIIDQTFSLEPSLEIKKLASETVFADLHAKFYYNRLNWGAISISTTKKVNIQFALRVYKMVYIGYSYFFSFGNTATFYNGAQEISAGINLGLTGVEGIRRTI